MNNRIRVLGIDPGFASLGVARLVRHEDGTLHAEAARVLTTKKASKKQRVALRVSADDLRRSRILWDGIGELAVGVQAVAYEVYTPFAGSGRTASGSKTALACGLAQALGFSLGIPVIPVLPVDIKSEVVRSKSASKAAVAEALVDQVAGLAELLEAISERKREHASDAAGVAFVGLLEIERLRRLALVH